MFHSDRDRKSNRREFHGFYRGEVVDINDPMRAGRVRVRVFGIFDDFTPNTIPWALYADSFMGGIGGSGGFFVPDMGSHVFVFFENGDPTQPVYFAGAPAREDGPSERMTNYGDNHVFKTRTGQTIEMNDGNGSLTLTHPSGTVVRIDSAGNVTTTVVGNVTHSVSGDYTINASGDVTITGARIDLN